MLSLPWLVWEKTQQKSKTPYLNNLKKHNYKEKDMFTRKSQLFYLATIIILASIGLIIILARMEMKHDPEFELSCFYRLNELCFNFK